MDAQTIDFYYKELLKQKVAFCVLCKNDESFVLTKEKSFFKVDDILKFTQERDEDKYYKTKIVETIKLPLDDALEIYKKLMKQYEQELSVNVEQYLFGTIAVRINHQSFITTKRGKTDLNGFAVVEKINAFTKTVFASEKATLNAPLLHNLFKNKKVFAILHFHNFNDALPTYDYFLPGTVKDSKRNNKTSFQIKHHGVFYLLDKNFNIL